jgi:flagellar basal-body rod modification protein FlgD
MSLIQSIDSITEKLLKPWVDPRPSASKAAVTEPQQDALMKALQGTATKAASTKSDVVSALGGDELGKDAFLELLVRQIQYQDPLEPTDNSQMLAQLAQFSALEQMNNLNTSFTNMASNMDQNNFLTGSLMLGREITGLDVDGETVEGVVEGVHMDGGIVYLTVGEQLVSMAGVLSIKRIDE